MKMMKTLILAVAVLASFAGKAATPETATGSSAYFHVCTSNETVRVVDVKSKYCDGEYGKGKGRNATFLAGITVDLTFSITTESQDEEDPIDHCVVVGTDKVIRMTGPDTAEYYVDAFNLEVGDKLEIKAVTRGGAESKPFRVNFDVAKIPDCFVLKDFITAHIEDDRVLYAQPEVGNYWLFQSADGMLKLKDLMKKTDSIGGLDFKWYPEFHLAVAMDSSTAKAMVGTLAGLGDTGKNFTSASKDGWKKLGKQKIGRLANADINVNLEGDIVAKWNPEQKIWVNMESVIGADIVYSGQASFRIPQSLYLIYVAGGLSGETHCLIAPRNDDQWKLTSIVAGQPLIEGFLEGGFGIDGFKIAGGGELGLILYSENQDLNMAKGLKDWGWGGQFYWTLELFNVTVNGNKGVSGDSPTDEASYRFQYWWWHDGVHVDSWSSSEEVGAELASAGPTKANAAKLAAVRPAALAASTVPYVCNPQPALATQGGVDALLYLTNATARATSDQSKLVFRKGADGAWGAVETPWDDGTADLSPSVGVANDGTVVAAWVNLKGQVGNPTQLTDITRKMEIAVGVRNPSTGVWTCKNLTADDQVDFSPRVAVAADGTAYVAWCANSDSAFYGSNTVVKCVKFAGGAWGSVVSLGKVGSVNGLAVAARGANGAIACTVEDGGVHKLRGFEVAGGSIVQSTTVVGESWIENPDVGYDAEGVARFHWVQDGALWTKRGFAAGDEAVVEGTADAALPHDAVYLKGADGVQGLVWQHAPKTDGTQNGVMLMSCDVAGKWQTPATLWLPAERASAFAGAYAADGTLRLAYESASGNRDEKGVMRYGAAALKIFELASGADVSVTANEIGIDGERVVYGVENDFIATIHNLGRTDAIDVPVKFIAVANGVTNEFFDVTTNIVAGGSVCVTSQWNAVTGYTNLVFKVLLDPEDAVADGNRANNVAEWSPKAGSLAITDERFVRETKTVCQVNAKVVTDGALVIPEGTVVEYRRGGVEGELLATDTLGEIVPGIGYSIGFRWDMSTANFTSAWETVYLRIQGNDHAIAAVRVMTTLDTDGDGVFDGEEELLGSDPDDPNSTPDSGDGTGGDEPPVDNRETFHFDGNGATSGSMADFVVNGDDFPLNQFVREGYTFLGWSLDPDATTARWADGEMVEAWQKEPWTNVHTLYAVWEKIAGGGVYAIRFNINAQSLDKIAGRMLDQIVTVGASVALTSNCFKRAGGYAFMGWAKDPYAGEPQFTDGQTVSGLATENGAVVDLYAVWKGRGETDWTVRTETVDGYAWKYRIVNGGAELYTETSYETGVMPKPAGRVVVPDVLGGYPVTAVGHYAFAECSELTEVILPDTVLTIGVYAFNNCSQLVHIELPDGLQAIYEGAFYDCASLVEFCVPKDCFYISDEQGGYIGVFTGCSSVSAFGVARGNDWFAVQDGVLYDKDFTTLIACPIGQKRVEIPETVTRIYGAAFEGCNALTELTLPKGLREIGRYAFWEMNIDELVVPGSVKLASGTTFAVTAQIEPSANHKLADGTGRVFDAGSFVQTFTVAGKKWTFPKHVAKPTSEKPDLNPHSVKLSFTEKTGLVKGTFVRPTTTGKSVKYTVNGVVVDGVMYGASFMKGNVPAPVMAK